MAAEARDTCRVQEYSKAEQSRGFGMEGGIDGSEAKRIEARKWIASMA
jgi:hypothetical protein